MVRITFKLSEIGRMEIPLAGPEKWQILVDRCAARAGVELGGILAVRGGTLLRGHDLVEDSDEIDVFPAISGG
jgi:molybdopterin converting factor small subunit